MADDIKVKPTPIQRNLLDVATELTLFHHGRVLVDSVEELQETFMKLYAVAYAADRLGLKEATQYMPKELADIVKSRSTSFG